MLYIYTPTTGSRAHDAIAPDGPSQEVGHWSEIILHTARVFIDPTAVLYLKSCPPLSVPLMVPAAIIEYAL